MSTLEEIRNEIRKKQEMRSLMRINELTGKKPNKTIQEAKHENDDDANDPRMDPTKDPYEGQPPPSRSSTRKSKAIIINSNQSPVHLIEQKEKVSNNDIASKKLSKSLSAVKKIASPIIERKPKENENVINLVQDPIQVKKEKVQQVKESPVKKVSPIQVIEVKKMEIKQKKRKEIVIDEPEIIEVVEPIKSVKSVQKEEIADVASSTMNDETAPRKSDKIGLLMRLVLSILHAILFAGVVFCAIVIIDMNKSKSGYGDEYMLDASPQEQQNLLESLSNKFSLVVSQIKSSNELVLANADISLHSNDDSNEQRKEVNKILIGMISGAIVGFVIGARN